MEPADLYRALIVMRADFDLLGEILKDEDDTLDTLTIEELRSRYVLLKKMVAIKVEDSEKLMTDLNSVRSRFEAFEMLGLAAPVPPEFVKG